MSDPTLKSDRRRIELHRAHHCMEMARDVRKLHSEADKSSAAVLVGLPAPVGSSPADVTIAC
jgi:hypothetical protein